MRADSLTLSMGVRENSGQSTHSVSLTVVFICSVCLYIKVGWASKKIRANLRVLTQPVPRVQGWPLGKDIYS